LADIIVPGTNIVNAGPADGKRLPFAPRTTINLGGDYQFDLGFGALDLNATYYRTSKFYAAPDNVAFQPAYDLVNVSLRWTDKSRHLSIAAWGKNLGKTVYATSLVEATLGEIRSIGAPRTYGVTAGFKF
jgi:iron complex outermembrane receptor protein